ncbi:tetratricopeptide (TPR) repeat protein [Actinoplanes octamycinicus]|uniref:Tetratricopeptide (TPR) repeat protein n=1 Tax=Actinoplanes octamycinicus TaxID=135948 RepID=A0A7W7H4E3_9ACTN|nr:hypothetical protein [Actinoplanes octamycinicus]MBB4743788.1 tetratricopeptide (TPR) repeat protein [Actinoplanes octamycinicus]GIE58414.1 hypothetical protein Aoc01nite_38160 [Actinoplanes octamycinicus]
MRVEIDPSWWASGTWEGRPIREFLERRDVTAIFRFLHARGVSYASIGGLVGISPNRAAEIAKNIRQVTAYEVLDRVAEGLGIPRAVMGLGYETGAVVPAAPVEPESFSGGLAALRVQLDEALAASSVTAYQLEMIEEATHDHVRGYLSTAPSVVLKQVTAECAEVLALSRRRQPAAVQARLSGAAALLATLSADALMRLGDATNARLWYRTAAAASDDSGQSRLRVLVRAHAAMLPYYFGDPQQTITLAEHALAMSTTPCPLTALAAAARARALARTGAAEQARIAMRQARQLFDQVEGADNNAAFEFPARRLLFYLSGTAAWAGDRTTAYQLQEEALELYRANTTPSIDPALILMDRSMCLTQEHRAGEAAAVAREAVGCLPEPQRTEIVLSRARDIVAAVPTGQRHGPVLELDEYLRECGRHAPLP